MPARRRASDARLRRVATGRRRRAVLAVFAVALPMIASAVTPGGDPSQAASPVWAQASSSPVTAATSLDVRVRLLSAELQLTPEQQLKVRALLERQREQVRRLWGDPGVAPALRVARTQGISDLTVRAIRDLLDESQRRRYIQPRQREAAVGTGGADLQTWMEPESKP